MDDYRDALDQLKQALRDQSQNTLLSQAQQAAAYQQQVAQLQNQINQMSNQSYSTAYGSNYPFSSGGAGGGSGLPWMGGGVNVQGPIDPLHEEMDQKKKRIRIQDLDIANAKDIINNVLKTNIVPFLWGPPGIGKSTLVRDICKENSWELIDLRLSLLNPVDLRGLPVIDKTHKQAAWYPPNFLPKKDTKKTGILFLDEINLAPLSVQAAAYQLILDKRVGEYEFPPHWRIIAAGNRETDRANVYKLSAPLANRFVHFYITAKLETWKNWARSTGIRPEVIDFISLRPSLLFQMPSDSEKAFPSPRSWAFTSDLLKAFNYSEENGLTEDVKQMVAGTIGEGVATEFLAFLQSYKIQEVKRMVDKFVDTGEFKMPKAPSLRYAFMMAIYDAYAADRVTKARYDKFFDALSGEEKRTLDEFDKEHGTEVRRKHNRKVPKPNPQAPMAVLMKDVGPDDDTFVLSNTSVLGGEDIIIFDNRGNIEEARFTKRNFNDITGVYRALNGTKKYYWKSGAYVQSI